MKFASALQLAQQASPDDPPSGYTALFVKAGDVPYRRTSAGVEQQLAPGMLFPFSRAGALTVAAGSFRLYNDTDGPLVIRAIRASVGTPPAGAAIIIDVNINGTTAFTTQGNRPTISDGDDTSGKVTTMDVTTFAAGDYLTVDIDQVGSGAPGADLTVQILC